MRFWIWIWIQPVSTGFRSNRSGKPLPEGNGLTGPVGIVNPRHRTSGTTISSLSSFRKQFSKERKQKAMQRGKFLNPASFSKEKEFLFRTLNNFLNFVRIENWNVWNEMAGSKANLSRAVAMNELSGNTLFHFYSHDRIHSRQGPSQDNSKENLTLY